MIDLSSKRIITAAPTGAWPTKADTLPAPLRGDASSIPQLGHHLAALAVLGVAAYSCAYSVVLFCHAWHNEVKG